MKQVLVSLLFLAMLSQSWAELRNRDIKLRSHQVKQGRDDSIEHKINVSMTLSKGGWLYKERARCKLIVIYKLPVKGGVYTYTIKDLPVTYKAKDRRWIGDYMAPHRTTCSIKFDGESAPTKVSTEFYDYMLLIQTDEATPKVFSSKSSWKSLYKTLQDLGTDSYFSSSGKQVKTFKKSLASRNR